MPSADNVDGVGALDEEPAPKPRAKRDIRELVSRVAEARRGAPEPEADDDHNLDIIDPDDDLKELEALRAELDQLGERLGAKS